MDADELEIGMCEVEAGMCEADGSVSESPYAVEKLWIYKIWGWEVRTYAERRRQATRR